MPFEEVDASVARLRHGGGDDALLPLIRSHDEGLAHGRAVLTAGLLTFVLTGVTFGLFALGLIMSMVSLRLYIVRIRGQGVPVGDRFESRVDRLVKLACHRLGMPRPPVYVIQDPDYNAFTIGLWDSNVIVLHSALVQDLSPGELLAVIGHELGHIKCRHVTLASLTRPPIHIQGLWGTMALGFVFNSWSLQMEYSADRAAMLASRAPWPMVRALIRMSTGRDPGERPDVRMFLEASEQHDALATIAEHLGDHPFHHNRISAVLAAAREPDMRSRLDVPATPAPVRVHY